MANKGKPWRVRVTKTVEDWVEVLANSPEEAEQLAANLPKVVAVFGRSAVPGDKPVTRSQPAGVLEDVYDDDRS